MSRAGLLRFTSLPALHDPDVLRAMVHVAIVSNVEVLPLVAMSSARAGRRLVGDRLPRRARADRGRNLVVGQALDLDLDGVLEEFIGAILDGDLLGTGLEIYSRMDPAVQERIAELAAKLPSGLRLRTGVHARHAGLQDALGPLGPALAVGH